MLRNAVFLFATIALTPTSLAAQPGPVVRKSPFDFTNADAVRHWSNLELPDAKVMEPPAKIAIDKGRLKITFCGRALADSETVGWIERSEAHRSRPRQGGPRCA